MFTNDIHNIDINSTWPRLDKRKQQRHQSH